jgi:cysteine/O-acetylserine efflux protein
MVSASEFTVKEICRMSVEIVPLVSFVLATTLSPGPNNISSASMGVLYGFRKTLNYLLGVTAGFFIVMLLCAWVSGALLRFVPDIEPTLRVVGSLYILWLAYGQARASYDFQDSGQPPMAFKMGFLLQALNPKVVVYGLTLYSTFLAVVANRPIILLVSAVLLAFTGFCAISVWAACGSLIREHLHQPRVRAAVNFGLVLLLIYTAAELSGMFQ